MEDTTDPALALEAPTGEALLQEAAAYLDLFGRERTDGAYVQSRLPEIRGEIARTGTYWQRSEELAHGARVAWRNSNRCIGRLFWRSLRVLDMRHLQTPDELFSACVEHLQVATNGGKLQPVMTVFAPQPPGRPGIRIWNPQLIRYAGYRHPDGRVTGDPARMVIDDALGDEV